MTTLLVATAAALGVVVGYWFGYWHGRIAEQAKRIAALKEELRPKGGTRYRVEPSPSVKHETAYPRCQVCVPVTPAAGHEVGFWMCEEHLADFRRLR